MSSSGLARRTDLVRKSVIGSSQATKCLFCASYAMNLKGTRMQKLRDAIRGLGKNCFKLKLSTDFESKKILDNFKHFGTKFQTVRYTPLNDCRNGFKQFPGHPH